MIIFIDSDYKCHAENDGTLREIETTFFDGKCKSFIEGYRFVPSGDEWFDAGEIYIGEMVSPWRDYSTIAELQAQYEEMLAERADMQAALDAIYGGVTDDGT